MSDRDDAATGAALDDWTARLCDALGIDPATVDRDAVLGLAGAVAHGVVRPAAPLTTFLAGIAVGRATAAGQDPTTAMTAAAATARTLIAPGRQD